MKKISYVPLFILALLSVMFVPPHARAASKFEVSGWIPYWRVATGTQDASAHLNQLTQINPFGYSVKADGTLSDRMNITQEPWTSLIAQAKVQKVRVIPTVMWSDGNAIDTILRDPVARKAHEDAIVAMVQQNNFDGVDIDYEGKLADTKPYFSKFLKELYKKMGNKWVMCTIEARTPLSSRFTNIPTDIQYANDFVAINKYCDRVNLMTYDQGTIDLKLNAAATGPYIPISDPAWVKKVVNLAAQNISKKKLVIGVPTYGYEYTVTPLTQGYRYDLQWAFNQKYALGIAQQLGITPTRNQAGELSFIYNPTQLASSTVTTNSDATGTPGQISTISTSTAQTASFATSTQPFNIVWWSDAQAIKNKIALAKQLGVRGIAIFKLDGGEDPNLWSVLPAQR